MSAKGGRLFFALVFAALFSSVRADDPLPVWSAPVHGLRARMFTTPSHEPMFDKTYDVWIEFQEVGLDTSLGLEHRSLTVRFSRPELQITLTGPDGSKIESAQKAGNLPVFTWDLVFPPSGGISFPIGQGGSHPHVVLGKTPPKGRLLNFDTLSEWVVPAEGGLSHLAVSFQVLDSGQLPSSPASDVAASVSSTNSDAPPVIGDAPNASPTPDGAASPASGSADPSNKPPYRGWSGTLVLPTIDLPQQ